MPSPTPNDNAGPAIDSTRNLERSLPTMSKLQAQILWFIGVIIILGSVGIIAWEAFQNQEITKYEVGVHVLIIGVGTLFLVPRRCLAVLERLPKFKFFGK